jgi:radical SAM family uncharacterized protein/radical SAM-linked protein
MEPLDAILLRVRQPGRYLGCETNAVRKDPARVLCRLALAFPDLYQIGMSHLGLQVLYELVNAEADLWAERVFAPDLDMEAALRAAGLPLATLESRTPLERFDCIGFSLQHELNYPDVLAMLELAGIPPRAADRGPDQPLVIAGGPCAANPEPLAPALDAVVLGDAEPVLAELLRRIGRARRAGRSRRQQLDALQPLAGVYLPGRYRTHYGGDGRLQAVEPLADAPPRVGRALLADLDERPPPTRPLVPCVPAVHDRLTIEIQRGCTRGCRFCQAGMINRPLRQRSTAAVLEAVDAGLAATGHDQVSFLSLSAGDHPGLLHLLHDFFARHAAARIAVSLPSLRAETLTPELAELVRTVRKSGFTIAPEAGSERLRRAINKDLDEADVLAAARGAFAAGWQLLKLYFMLGLPGETEPDRAAIAALVARLRRELKRDGRRVRINVGLSTFVPKPHTPFQWDAMIDADEAGRRLAATRAELGRLGGVRASGSNPLASWAEGVLARGDRRLFEPLLALARAGRRLAGWSEHFHAEAFAEALATAQVPGGADFYLRRREPDDCLPWQHLDLGPSRDFLLAERQRAERAEPTADCARDACADCGACDDGAAPRLADAPRRPIGAPVQSATADPGPPPVRRARLQLARRGPARHLGHRAFMVAVMRALRRAGWPLLHSSGFHPKPRLSFGPACQTGAASEAEWVDVRLLPGPPLATLAPRLAGTLDTGIALLDWRELEPGEPDLMAAASGVRYRIGLNGDLATEQIAGACRALLARPQWVVERQVKGRRKRVDLRPSLRRLEPVAGSRPPAVLLELELGPGACARPAEVARQAFGADCADITREALIWRTAEQKEACR